MSGQLRDVYFWSKATGLISFPGAIFDAHAEQDSLGLSSARPSLITVSHERPKWDVLALLNATGLLWTSDKTGIAFPHVVPVTASEVKCAARLRVDGEVVYDIEICWRSLGAFIAEGFSKPEVIQTKRSVR